jgi:predicted regulator of Ras-like GTPase activity (Roadblock/LC7/MglB family)
MAKMIPQREDGRARRERMRQCLTPLVDKAGVLCVVLVSRSGLPVGSCGKTEFIDEAGLAALVAAAFAATREVAELLGEEGFSIMFQQGEGKHIYLSIVSEDMMMVVVFDRSDKIGLVRYYAKVVQKRLEAILPGSKPKAEKAEGDFKDYAANLIDKIFGD